MGSDRPIYCCLKGERKGGVQELKHSRDDLIDCKPPVRGKALGKRAGPPGKRRERVYVVCGLGASEYIPTCTEDAPAHQQVSRVVRHLVEAVEQQISRTEIKHCKDIHLSGETRDGLRSTITTLTNAGL